MPPTTVELALSKHFIVYMLSKKTWWRKSLTQIWKINKVLGCRLHIFSPRFWYLGRIKILIHCHWEENKYLHHWLHHQHWAIVHLSVQRSISSNSFPLAGRPHQNHLTLCTLCTARNCALPFFVWLCIENKDIHNFTVLKCWEASLTYPQSLLLHFFSIWNFYKHLKESNCTPPLILIQFYHLCVTLRNRPLPLSWPYVTAFPFVHKPWGL